MFICHLDLMVTSSTQKITAERTNARLKEEFGANNVMVKGHAKVSLYLMLGVVVLFADQLIRLLE